MLIKTFTSTLMLINDVALPLAIKAQLQQLGHSVAMARVARGWSQDDLAQRLGTSRRTVVNVESGAPGVAIGTVLHLAWLLELSLDQALLRSNSIAESPSARRRAPRRAATPDLDF